MRFLVYIIIFLFFLGCKTSVVHNPSIEITEWSIKFDQIAAKKGQYITSLSETNDSRKYYDLSYYLDAFGTMYKVSHEDQYLDTFFELVENVVSQAQPSSTYKKSQYKDEYLGWIDKSSPIKKNHGGEYPLYESYCWRYICLLYTSPSPRDKRQSRMPSSA